MVCGWDGVGAGGYIGHIIGDFSPDRERIPGCKAEGFQWCDGVWPAKAECPAWWTAAPPSYCNERGGGG